MNDVAHIIDIDQIVLTGIDQHEFVHTSELIATAVQQALAGTELDRLPDATNQRARVSGAVARSVVQAVARD
jgi:hypothetical protein